MGAHMNGEQGENKDPGRHISMELTADSARVTSLSLQGSRLVVTIEAELADSQVHAAERTGKKCPQSESTEASTRLRRRDTEIVRRAASSPPGGPVAAPEVPEGASSFAMGSENLRPAPAAYTPVTNDPHNPAFDDPAATLPAPALYSQPAPSDTQPIAGMGAPVNQLEETETDAVNAALPAAPPLEPVRELTDTWDEPGAANRVEAMSPGFVQEPWAEAEAAPAEVAGPDEQDLKETAADEAVYGSEPARQWTEPTPVTPPPVAPPAPPAYEQPVVTNDPHNPAFGAPAASQIPAPADEPLAITEESSAIGGERHGEPQPTFSYGGLETIPTPAVLVPPPAPELEPASPPPAPAPAPASEPEAPETGGTTVLIRYTCPKCKTQGMQAVDKVGTVVNCSNCGKAMRLVMKK